VNRKQRRHLKKLAGEKATSSIDLMLNMSENCLTCSKPFDKKDKQMAATWFIKVYHSQKRTELFCPECFKNGSVDGIREE
jgi:hypothetical protein